jgi:xanthine phosphoribosyltransferase
LPKLNECSEKVLIFASRQFKIFLSFVSGDNILQILKERIKTEGRALPGGIIKVGSFLNHMVDTKLAHQIGCEFASIFKDAGVNKILTIECSGIPFAILAGVELGVPVVFAKKAMGSNTIGDAWTTFVRSYTKGTETSIFVTKQYLGQGDRVLIIDDFLAYGEAVSGLSHMVKQSGAVLCGVGIVIEKAYEPGGERLRQAGIRVESLARISSVDNGVISFTD